MSKTAIEVIRPSDLTDNDTTIRKGADELIVKSKEIVIDSVLAMEDGATIAKSLKSLAKKVEDIRKHRLEPLKEQVDAINLALKTNVSDRLTNAAKDVENKMLHYTKEQQRIAEQERIARAKEEEEARFAAMIIAEDAGEDDQVIFVPEPQIIEAVMVPQITRSLTGAIAGVRKTWTFEVIDIVALVDARPDLVEAVSSKINSEIKGEDGKRDIPGLRIYQQESMSVR